MTPTDLAPALRLSVPLAGDPELIAAVALRGPGGGGAPTLVVAGPPSGDGRGAVILARRGARTATLLALPDVALRRAPDLVALPDGTALALVPGRGLLRLDPAAAEASDVARPVATGAHRPVRLAAPGGTPVAASLDLGGRLSWMRLRPDGRPDGRTRVPGPALAPGQALGALAADAGGRPLVVLDDPGAGLSAWARGPDGRWTRAVEAGAGRFALDAASRAVASWDGGLVIAAGPTEALRARLPGLSVSGELLLLRRGAPAALLAGELRPTPRGLLVPEVGARGMAALGPGVPVALAVAGGALVVALERDDGRTALRAIRPDRRVEDLGEVGGCAVPVALDGGGYALVLPEE